MDIDQYPPEHRQTVKYLRSLIGHARYIDWNKIAGTEDTTIFFGTSEDNPDKVVAAVRTKLMREFIDCFIEFNMTSKYSAEKGMQWIHDFECGPIPYKRITIKCDYAFQGLEIRFDRQVKDDGLKFIREEKVNPILLMARHILRHQNLGGSQMMVVASSPTETIIGGIPNVSESLRELRFLDFMRAITTHFTTHIHATQGGPSGHAFRDWHRTYHMHDGCTISQVVLSADSQGNGISLTFKHPKFSYE